MKKNYTSRLEVLLAKIAGNAPVDPRALNIFIIKYDAKHVMTPILNLKLKLKLRR